MTLDPRRILNDRMRIKESELEILNTRGLRNRAADVLRSRLNRRVRGSAAAMELKHFERFFKAHPPRTASAGYVYGAHTLALIAECQRTTRVLERGGSRFVIVNVPFRHGKSDIASRRYPVWHLLRNPDHEVILASYNATLASGMSFEARECFRENAGTYGYALQRGREGVGEWRIEDKAGGLFATGIGGTITGRGAHLMVIDDYCKNREDAESPRIREKTWEAFGSDMMTRLAPNAAVMIVANRWHTRDLVGRILAANDPRSEDYDPDFPKFELIKYPAQADGGSWLFTERYSDSWYRSAKAQLGTYAWAAMGQQEPVVRGGNIFTVDRIGTVEEAPEDLPFAVRCWDLASTEKQRMKANPDFTVGALVAMKDGAYYVLDVIRGRWEGPKRDQIIRATGEADPKGTAVYVESVAGYKDAFNYVKKLLRGKAIVRKYVPHDDKVARCTATLEAPIEAGAVKLVRAPWNRDFLAELEGFPGLEHDDQVDAFESGVRHARKRTGMLSE